MVLRLQKNTLLMIYCKPRNIHMTIISRPQDI